MDEKGDRYESVACDNRDLKHPSFYLTTDSSMGQLIKFMPNTNEVTDALHEKDFWPIQTSPGKMEFLQLIPYIQPTVESSVGDRVYQLVVRLLETFSHIVKVLMSEMACYTLQLKDECAFLFLILIARPISIVQRKVVLLIISRTKFRTSLMTKTMEPFYIFARMVVLNVVFMVEM